MQGHNYELWPPAPLVAAIYNTNEKLPYKDFLMFFYKEKSFFIYPIYPVYPVHAKNNSKWIQHESK